jgi:ABC-type antimicrobial peptide transport system permease subunit
VAFTRESDKSIEIVGVVRASKYRSVDERAPRVIYTPFAQEENPSSLVMYVRAAGDPRRLSGAVRREVAALDGELPVTNLRTMDEQVSEALSAERMMAALSTAFAVLATLLAAVGLYGVMAYTVTRRTREIGIRLALGAGPTSLVGMVMREVAVLTAAGVAIAVPVVLMLARLVEAQLYGIGPGDPVSLLLASAVLVAVSLVAGYIPAERATRVNPLRALRYE